MKSSSLTIFFFQNHLPLPVRLVLCPGSCRSLSIHSQMANAVSVLSVGIVDIMHRRWFVANNAQSGQSELGSVAVEGRIRWRAPSRAPRGSGVGNRKTQLAETPYVHYPRSVACRTEARSAARCRGNLIRDTQVRHGSRFALAWGSLCLRRRCPASPIRSRRPAN